MHVTPGVEISTLDDTSSIKIGDRTIVEGDAGSVGVVFTVSLSVQNSPVWVTTVPPTGTSTGWPLSGIVTRARVQPSTR